ncbi:hypothetical protein IWQ57_001664 [Coemansia nantahalensis]|uniref:Uncharacterized protein n=1 Tax=Coemansia nantahalensis TaxID=2789366 RepID=A0ACC1K3R8_9FUNG|nr:hypothetical protein IWQ57_001664 [Coemansia nantahalensis]
MRTIANAIRPRKQQPSNDSVLGLRKQRSAPVPQVSPTPNRHLASEDGPVRLEQSATVGARPDRAAPGSRAAVWRRHRLSIGSTTDSLEPWDDGRDTAGADEHGLLYVDSPEDAELDGPTIASAAGESAVSLVSAAPAVAAVAAAGGDGRGRIMSYIHRLPLHILGAGRLGDRAGGASAGCEAGWARDSIGRGRRLGAKELAQSVAEEAAAAAAGSSIFSGEQDLLKRVSSVPGNLLMFRAHLNDPLLHPEFRAPPRYTRYQSVQLPVNEPDDTPVYGYALLALTSVLFIASMYSLVVSKFVPYTGVPFLDAVKDDRYFCLLMPVTGLSFGFAVFWNWLGMKFFRHN